LLWKILDGRTDKERIENIYCDIQEANQALQSVIINSNGDGREHNTSLPWLLTKQQRNIVKEVIQKIRFPTNIQNILTKKGDFGGVKTDE
jgi:RecG-like helicase